MPGTTEIQITGMAEVKKALQSLPTKMAERITRMALRTGGNFMLKNIKAATPKKTGRLQKAIKIKNSKLNTLKRNGVVGIFISISPGKSRKDLTGAYYGKFVEAGYQPGGHNKKGGKHPKAGGVKSREMGKRVPGRRMVRDTFNRTKAQTGQILVTAIQTAAAEVTKELGFQVS
jgi:HK97 gp10 family phage protein